MSFFTGPNQPEPIFSSEFAPAQFVLREWRDYWLEIPGATHLQIGSRSLFPVAGTLFALRFENRLGLAQIQAFSDEKALGEPLGAPLWAEVISPKFATLEAHTAFFSALLRDLFRHNAVLPFAPTAPTQSRAQSRAAPSLWGAWRFLAARGSDLEAALAPILAHPQAELMSETVWKPLAAVSSVGSEIFSDLSGARWHKTSGGLLPLRARERQTLQTLDTPFLRFVWSFLAQIEATGARFKTQSWWPWTPENEREKVAATLQSAQIARRRLENLGVVPNFAPEPPDLARRERFRALEALWRAWNSDLAPVWDGADAALALRDVAALYEFWAFFALVEAMTRIWGRQPAVEAPVCLESGLRWNSRADFGAFGTLFFQAPARSYSTALRPDFLWKAPGAAPVVFDAKFRAQIAADETKTLRGEGLHKMHAYRDALGARAAVALYPGEKSQFFHRDGRRESLNLAAILNEDAAGVGAIALVPESDSTTHKEHKGFSSLRSL